MNRKNVTGIATTMWPKLLDHYSYVEAFRRNYADASGTGTDNIYQNVYGM